MTLEAGTTIGRYQILGTLGYGGMATVYKAFQPALEREVALKVVRPAYAHDPEFLERFRREALAIARLRHPHIVQVHDFDEAAGLVFLVMEHIEGGTLKQKLTQLQTEGAGLPWGETGRIVGEVAEALAHAHAQGIVHRDVKPSNVMLTRDGRSVVTDFGIAKILAASGQTQTGVGVGTPEYMSPEQGQAAPVDHRSDVYSLGVMAYELLTGRVPFTADTPLAVMLAHVREPLPLPSKVDPRIGPRIEQVLLRALAKDPAARYQSAPEFGRALETAIAVEERGGTIPTVVSTGARPARPRVTAASMRAIPLRITNRSFVVSVLGGVLLLYIAGTGAREMFRGEQQPGTGTPPAATSDLARSSPAPRTEPPRAPSPATTASAATTITSQATATLPPSMLAPAPAFSTLAVASVPVTAPPQSPSVAAPTATLPPPTATLPPPTATPRPTVFPPPTDPNAPKFAVSGRVTSALTGAGIAAVHVGALPTDVCCYGVAGTQTDASGVFTLNLAANTYRIQFLPTAGSGYAPRYFGGGVSYRTGADVVVTASATPRLDVQLTTGFRVSGRVTTQSGGPPPAASTPVVSFNLGSTCCDHIGGLSTNADGTWAIRLPNGTYWLNFFAQCPPCNEQFTTAGITVNGSDLAGIDKTLP